MQDVNNLFEVDTVAAVLHHVERIAGKKYGENEKDDISIRVITAVPRHCGHVHRYGGVHCAAGHRIVPVCVASGRDQYARGGRGCH